MLYNFHTRNLQEVDFTFIYEKIFSFSTDFIFKIQLITYKTVTTHVPESYRMITISIKEDPSEGGLLT